MIKSVELGFGPFTSMLALNSAIAPGGSGVTVGRTGVLVAVGDGVLVAVGVFVAVAVGVLVNGTKVLVAVGVLVGGGPEPHVTRLPPEIGSTSSTSRQSICQPGACASNAANP